MNTQVLKAFIFDLATTAATAVAIWLTSTANVEKLGVSADLAPIVVALVGAAIIALRRYNIIKKAS